MPRAEKTTTPGRASSQAVRGPGLALLRMVRSIPIVRRRVIPSLLKAQLDQVPAAPIVAAMTRDLERLRKSSGPILIGPWISEVGFEVPLEYRNIPAQLEITGDTANTVEVRLRAGNRHPNS